MEEREKLLRDFLSKKLIRVSFNSVTAPIQCTIFCIKNDCPNCPLKDGEIYNSTLTSVTARCTAIKGNHTYSCFCRRE